MSKTGPVNNHSQRMALFESVPIPTAVMVLAVPTIITQLINIIYNFADTWYVGRTGNAGRSKTDNRTSRNFPDPSRAL